MAKATNTDIQTMGGSMDYWGLAYSEALKVYNSGEYSLVSDYGSLFTVQGENSTESIFELQIAQDAANSQIGRNFTPWKYKAGMHFGWFQVTAFQHDKHVAAYGGGQNWTGPTLITSFPDKRYNATYLHQYYRADRTAPAGNVRVYPSAAWRGGMGSSHPYLFKWVE